MAKTKDSPALQFVRLIFTEGQKATGHSWTRLNGALFGAAKVAIEGGLLFDIGDFNAFYSELRAGYWIGRHPEGLYVAACKHANLSACKSYEHCYEFAPYELDGQRVFVGHNFDWNGEHVSCTSIAKEALTACSYKPQAPGTYERKILHRYAITNEEMAAENKKRQAASQDKKMAKARDEAAEFVRGNRISEKDTARFVADLIGKVSGYRQETVQEILKRRFKKAEKPTIMDLLTVAHRWRGDCGPVTSAVMEMLAKEPA